MRNEHIRGTTSGTGFQNDRREKIELDRFVMTRDGEQQLTNVLRTGEKKESTEKRASPRIKKYWNESGQGDIHGHVARDGRSSLKLATLHDGETWGNYKTFNSI